VFFIHIIVDEKQVGPPVLLAEVSLRSNYYIPTRTRTQFIEQCGIKEYDYYQGWSQPTTETNI
jgi:hypothetical protein